VGLCGLAVTLLGFGFLTATRAHAEPLAVDGVVDPWSSGEPSRVEDGTDALSYPIEVVELVDPWGASARSDPTGPGAGAPLVPPPAGSIAVSASEEIVDPWTTSDAPAADALPDSDGSPEATDPALPPDAFGAGAEGAATVSARSPDGAPPAAQSVAPAPRLTPPE
jgi:hypothetical protein